LPVGGRWTACASSGGPGTAFNPASQCSSATFPARVALELPRGVSGRRLRLRLRVPPVLVGRRARISAVIYREALLLTDLGELSQVQAAQAAGLSVPGMKARVQRARAQLHARLTRCCDIALDGSHRVADVQRRGRCDCAPDPPAPSGD
jgi:hypothetical protein